jgi:hypothetical protein
MTPYTKQKLCDVALQKLEASKDDEPEYSFLIETTGSQSILWHEWVDEVDWGEFDIYLAEVWDEEKIRELSKITSPTPVQIREWQRAVSQASLILMTDHVRLAWIVPLWINEGVEGCALFVEEGNEPKLDDVFEDEEACLAHLKTKGEIFNENAGACSGK